MKNPYSQRSTIDVVLGASLKIVWALIMSKQNSRAIDRVKYLVFGTQSKNRNARNNLEKCNMQAQETYVILYTYRRTKVPRVTIFPTTASYFKVRYVTALPHFRALRSGFTGRLDFIRLGSRSRGLRYETALGTRFITSAT